MQKANIIRIKDEFPDTHLFIYQGKQYPFKIDYFKLSSEYFRKNQTEFERIKTIQLIDENSVLIGTISEDIIYSFIKFVQHEPISLSNENAAILDYLGNKYQIKSLTDITFQYINNHKKEIALSILSFYQNDPKYSTEIYEDLIINNLEDYFEDSQLLTLNLSLLYRIISQYKIEKGKEIKEKEKQALNEILFKCLDKFGKEASILFQYFEFGTKQIEYIKRLLNEYKEILDFSFVNSSFFESFFVYENCLKHEIESEKKKNEEASLSIQNLKDEVEELKKKNIQQMNEINRLNEVIKNLQEEKKLKEDQIKTQQQNNQKLQNQIQIHQQTNKELQDQIQIHQQTNKELQDQIQIHQQANKKLQDQIQIQQKNNKEFQDQKIKLLLQNQDNKVSKLNPDELYFIQNQKYIEYFDEENVEEFNKLSGEKQISLIDFLKFIIDNENINNVFILLKYLSNKSNNLSNFSYVFKYLDINNKKEPTYNFSSRIGITYSIVDLLFKNNQLMNNEFIGLVKNFSEFYFQIQYPSQLFENIYDAVINIKSQSNPNVKIEILITEIKKVDIKFQNNKEIASIKFDSNIKYIGETFVGCSSVTKITIPSSVTKINNKSFKNYSSLIQISIPSSVTSIESYSFCDCSSLEKIFIPSSVNKIGINAFCRCIKLVEIRMPSSVTEIENSVFEGCSLLGQFEIPSSVKSIGMNAFFGCSSLTRLNIPSSVTKIGMNAFSGCSSLTELTIPNSVTSIGINVIDGCKSLKTLSIPSSISSFYLRIPSYINVTYT